MLNDYDDKCFDKYDFIYAADKYLDTVTTDTPVASIMFSKPFNFEPNGDLSDEDLKKMALWKFGTLKIVL